MWEDDELECAKLLPRKENFNNFISQPNGSIVASIRSSPFSPHLFVCFLFVFYRFPIFPRSQTSTQHLVQQKTKRFCFFFFAHYFLKIPPSIFCGAVPNVSSHCCFFFSLHRHIFSRCAPSIYIVCVCVCVFWHFFFPSFMLYNTLNCHSTTIFILTTLLSPSSLPIISYRNPSIHLFALHASSFQSNQYNVL